MKVITIQISVPDGAEVRVNNGGQQQQQQAQRPFVAQSAPAYPGGVCPEHGEEWNLVPAGVSRSKVDANGNPKRYNAFWTCPAQGCQQKPPKPNAVEDVTYSGEGGGYDPQLPF